METFSEIARKLVKTLFTEEEMNRIKTMNQKEFQSFMKEKGKDKKIQNFLKDTESADTFNLNDLNYDFPDFDIDIPDIDFDLDFDYGEE
jgi:hypothetical protein